MTADDLALLEEAQKFDRAGQKEQAVQAFEQYLALHPKHADAWADYAGLLIDMERWEDAKKVAGEALVLDDRHYEGMVHSGCAMMHLGQIAAAEQRFRGAIELAPLRLGGRLLLSDCLVKSEDLPQARALLDQIVKEQPDCLPAQNRLSTLYLLQKDWPSLRKDLARQVHSFSGPEAVYRQSHLSLLFGDMAIGWQEFEARLDIPGRVIEGHAFAQPRWAGEPFPEKTLLLHWEQGFGDTLMFIRFASMAKRLGGKVLVEVQPHLADLVATCPGVDQAIPHGSPLPPFDLQAPLLSLPSIFKTDLGTIPAEVPYLDIPGDVPNRDWISEALAPSQGRIRIGIAWAGSPMHQRNTKRSMKAEAFNVFADLPGVSWFSFQHETEQPPELPGILDLAPLLSNFSDTAYALSGMDLVITVDTALAHLAGAMGIPTWLMLSFIPDWRWMLDREDSPWYPTVRLFRQTRPGDWESALQQISTHLNPAS